MSALRQAMRWIQLQWSTAWTRSGYYRLSPTCQIPNLGTIYEQHFGQTNQGCFVEVGAYDGEYASNTSGLADRGWTGYYIEPVPEYARRCRERHAKNPGVIVSQCAIGAEPRVVEVHVGGPLSTIRDDAKRNFESLDWATDLFTGERVEAEQKTLEAYLDEHEVKAGFELLVVDVEGSEWDVFRNFDLRRWQPLVVIVELHDRNDDYLFLRDECNCIVRYFRDSGYQIFYKDSSNTIYVRTR